MSTDRDEGLRALVDALAEEAADTAWPPEADPGPGETHGQWLEAVMHARALADARALQHREAVDRLSLGLFGTTSRDLLPDPGPGLTQRTVEIDVPPRAGIADAVPSLAGGVPRGPGPRVPASSRVALKVTVTAPTKPQGAVIRMHGGAFWMGGGPVPALIDRQLVEHLAGACALAVYDVDYRLAPEYPFPAAIVDVLWVLAALRRGDLGDVDPRRIGLLGTSSGANTAVAVARAAAVQSGQPPLRAMALIVPSVLLTHGAPDSTTDPEAAAARGRQLRAYLGPSLPASDPWVSPAVLPEIGGLPPTLALLAEHDEVARGGDLLCRAIVTGGGVAELRTYPMMHTTAAPAVEARVVADAGAFLRSRLVPHAG